MYTNILIPVVFEENQDYAAVFEVAKALAGPDAKMTIMHVAESVPGYALTTIPHEVLKDAETRRNQLLADVAAQLPGATAKMVSGHAGQTIVEFAKESGTDCIVVASHKPGIEDFFLGSTAARVVRHAPCAVHVIR